jgi:hypothetical protein
MDPRSTQRGTGRFAARPVFLAALGAGEGNRTPDLLITSEPLCRLSYPGVYCESDVDFASNLLARRFPRKDTTDSMRVLQLSRLSSHVPRPGQLQSCPWNRHGRARVPSIQLRCYSQF